MNDTQTLPRTDNTPSVHPLPPETWQPARAAALALVKPLGRFLKIQASSSILLLAMAVLALIWANSPYRESYQHLWHTPIGLRIGNFGFEQDLHFWINDGLMVVFFFVVGLEIRREMHEGELADLKRASLPMAAALGGMAAPALIFLAANRTPDAARGWGVPMATDIAFAVGALMLLGRRVPAALRVLLLALAVIDDIGGILVIAVFYSQGFAPEGLAVAFLGLLGVMLFQRIGLRQPLLYVIPGLVIWAGFFHSGVHPTLAGVMLGLLTPVRSWYGETGFVQEASAALEDFTRRAHDSRDHHELVHPLQRINVARREAISPVVRLETALNPWVAYGIMPLFALANAGVTLQGLNFELPGAMTVLTGVTAGLVLGKPLGIVAASLLAARIGISALPRGVDWRGLLVVGALAGIGFTVALFIATLAFNDPAKLAVAKLGILVGSVVSAVLGLVLGRSILPATPDPRAAVDVDEAERSTEL